MITKTSTEESTLLAKKTGLFYVSSNITVANISLLHINNCLRLHDKQKHDLHGQSKMNGKKQKDSIFWATHLMRLCACIHQQSNGCFFFFFFIGKMTAILKVRY
jgi:hypothetical protein